MKPSRIAFWDNTKLLLITLVVIGHFVTSQFDISSHSYKAIFIFIYTFHMPLFIFISGTFHKNENIARKALQFFTYYTILKIMLTLARTIFFGEQFQINLFSEAGLPWFMFVLGAYNLITYLLRKIKPVYLLLFSIILACAAGFDSSIGDFLVLSRIIVYYPFYLAGIMIPRKTIEQLTGKKKYKIIGVLIIFAFIIVCIAFTDNLYALRPFVTGRNPFPAEFGNTGFLYRLLCYAITSAVSFGILMLTPARQLPAISSFGQRTIQVYTYHYIVIYLLTFLNFSEAVVKSQGTVGIILALLLAIFVTLVLSTKLFKYPSSVIFNSDLSLPLQKSRDK